MVDLRSGDDRPCDSAQMSANKTCNASKSCETQLQQHTVIVLFYKYFVSRNDDDKVKDLLIQQYPEAYIGQLHKFCKDLCVRLSLKGRILIASEGINGTVSADTQETLHHFIDAMETFDLVQAFGLPNGEADFPTTERLFEGIDWKISSTTSSAAEFAILEPFPDLKLSIVKEIISTGGAVSVDDVKVNGGTHLSPAEFHQFMLDHPDAAIIDVRNTFEYAIGHFVHPSTLQPAMNPETVHFSSFDATFCATNADALKDRKVLMYCTGGIRCEKASVMLKQRGVANVFQLSGGIHRYLETYGDSGFFRGKNFVFDQRVAQKPSECGPPQSSRSTSAGASTDNENDGDVVVGKCTGCSAAFDELCGSRVCTVCRDLVLVCPACQSSSSASALRLREYHCARHAAYKSCYFTFLDVFDRDALSQQRDELLQLRDTFLPAAQHKNVRRTLLRQIEKVAARIEALDSGAAVTDRNAPLRCRTCMETSNVCDGRCWGFWKTHAAAAAAAIRLCHPDSDRSCGDDDETPDPIAVGDLVEPGPDWNVLRRGSRIDAASGNLLQGTVMEVKTWGAGGKELDCLVVCWSHDAFQTPLIYRWGVLAINGKRMYDVQRRSTKG